MAEKVEFSQKAVLSNFLPGEVRAWGIKLGGLLIISGESISYGF